MDPGQSVQGGKLQEWKLRTQPPGQREGGGTVQKRGHGGSTLSRDEPSRTYSSCTKPRPCWGWMDGPQGTSGRGVSVSSLPGGRCHPHGGCCEKQKGGNPEGGEPGEHCPTEPTAGRPCLVSAPSSKVSLAGCGH